MIYDNKNDVIRNILGSNDFIDIRDSEMVQIIIFYSIQ